MPPRFKKFKLCPGQTQSHHQHRHRFTCLSCRCKKTQSHRSCLCLTKTLMWFEDERKILYEGNYEREADHGVVGKLGLHFLLCSLRFRWKEGKVKTRPDFRKKLMKMRGMSHARRLTCAWCTYDMQIGAKQTIAKRSPIVDSFLASASPIRASLLTCKITSLSFCRFLFTVWQKESSWRPVPSLFDQDCANSPPRH